MFTRVWTSHEKYTRPWSAGLRFTDFRGHRALEFRRGFVDLRGSFYKGNPPSLKVPKLRTTCGPGIHLILPLISLQRLPFYRMLPEKKTTPLEYQVLALKKIWSTWHLRHHFNKKQENVKFPFVEYIEGRN